MRFFTYGRKSVYSDKSDSINNQFRMCREFCDRHFPGKIETWTEFSDEDYTGGNTNRPGFQKMMSFIRDNMCDVLVVYQLDRFSRDVKDFSVAYDEMRAHNVRFICLDLNIDTSTPIGEAMMYVSAAFGQMERKNIALRVTDNLIGLVKKGLWVGGRAPIGYVRVPVTIGGRNHVSLAVDPDGAEHIKELFDIWVKGDYSLQGLETKFRNEKKRSYHGSFYATNTLYRDLTAPYYCEATKEVYDYFEALGCQMDNCRELWDGSTGVIVYNRSTEKRGPHQLLPPTEWIVCKGLHDPFLSADIWLAAQEKFTHNKCFRKKKYPNPLLRGVLRCSCGGLMNVGTKKCVSGLSRSYRCIRHQRYGNDVCDRGQVVCSLIDSKVMEIFSQIESDPDVIWSYVKSEDPVSAKSADKIKKKLVKTEDKIRRLTSSLALAQNEAASKYIIDEINSLDSEMSSMKAQIMEAESAKRAEADSKKEVADKVETIQNLIRNLSGFSADERNEIACKVIKEATWDGETLFIVF